MKKQLKKIIALFMLISTCAIAFAQDSSAVKQKVEPVKPMSAKERKEIISNRQADNSGQRIDMRVKNMKAKLSLTDAQAAKVKNLLTAQDKRTQKHTEEMKKQQEKMDKDMAKILTPEQMEKYKQGAQKPKKVARPDDGGENPAPAEEKK